METGRQNKGRISAYSEQEALDILAERGITPIEINRLPPDVATQPQLDYLRDLGVSVPAAVTKNEASDLIENSRFSRNPAPAEARAMAARYSVEVTTYTSKENIYRDIVQTLLSKNDLLNLAEWYAFRVYRSRCNRADPKILTSPSDPRFSQVALKIIADPSAAKSLEREAKRTFTGFRWFGVYRGNQGDSERTAVFRFTDAILKDMRLPGSASIVPTAPTQHIPIIGVGDSEFVSSYTDNQDAPGIKHESSGNLAFFLALVAFLAFGYFCLSILVQH